MQGNCQRFDRYTLQASPRLPKPTGSGDVSRPAFYLDLPLLGALHKSTYIPNAFMLWDVVPTAKPEEGCPTSKDRFAFLSRKVT